MPAKSKPKKHTAPSTPPPSDSVGDSNDSQNQGAKDENNTKAAKSLLFRIGKRKEEFAIPREYITLPTYQDGRFNVRKDFGDIAEFAKEFARGQKFPLLGKVVGDKFEVTDGERRLRAYDYCVENGIPVKDLVVRPEPQGYTDMERTLDLLTANSGKPLTMPEQAEVYRRLRDDFALNVASIAERSGKTQQHVYDCLSLLDAPTEVKEAIAEGSIAPTLAVNIVKHAETPEEAKDIVDSAIEQAKAEGKSRATAKHVRKATASRTPKSRKSQENDAISEAAKDMLREEQKTIIHEAATFAADSVEKLRTIKRAVPPSQTDATKMEALDHIIMVLLGEVELPDSIEFFKL